MTDQTDMLRSISMNSAAEIARHSYLQRHRAARDVAPVGELAGDTTRRPQRAPRTPEHCGSSDLRSHGGEHLGVV